MRRAIDLASDRLRGYVLASSDQACTSHVGLLGSNAPNSEGGWRTRRRRDTGHDWAILRLGVPGILESLELETDDDRPTHILLEGCSAPHTCPVDKLKDWETLVSKSVLEDSSSHRFAITSGKRYTHLRLSIFPDGSITRLRALGHPVPAWMAPGGAPPGSLDLAAVANGAELNDWSDSRSGVPTSLIYPGSRSDKTPGWTTRRRRQSGHEWVTIRLGAAGRVVGVTFDTEGLEGDIPAKVSLEGSSAEKVPAEGEWQGVLPAVPALPNTEHHFSAEVEDNSDIRWVRLKLHPDGGMTRLRVWGELSPEGLVECRLRYLNSASPGELREIFRAVCHSDRWASQMALAGPFDSVSDLQKKGAGAWSHCRENDWREALLGHPRIGEKAKGGDLASRWSRGEQSKAATPDDQLKAELRDMQVQYEERFGFLFLICATGRTTEQILSVLKTRIEQAPELELQTVAEELAKIIHLRLEKLLVS